MAVGTQYSYNVNGLKCSVQLYFEITNENYVVCRLNMTYDKKLVKPVL